jgi:prepilin-type N-terminal cleavage/methylation domain-containing protein
MLNIKKHTSHGFTLLEILLVVGIIAILAGIVIVAINPSRQLATARDTERRSDLKQINNALLQYYIDNQKFPNSFVNNNLTEICNSGSGDGLSCPEGTIDLSILVPKYLSAIPADPKGSTAAISGYQIALSSSRKLYLKAPNTEIPGTYIAIGSGEEVVVDACGVSGDATDPDCWTHDVNGYIWGPAGITTGLNELTSAADNGAANTTALIQREIDYSESYPAAHYCATLTKDGHSDWYLPAKNQLVLGLETYKNQYNLGNTTWGGFRDHTFYWSSTESSNDPAYDSWSGLYQNDYNVVGIVESNSKFVDHLRGCCIR